MSTIRRQSLVSSGIVYFGFGLGALNTLLAARGLAPAEYGLISGMFISIGNIMYSCANLGMPFYIQKFFPYYHDNLPARENDIMTWALSAGLLGFGLVTVAGLAFKPLVIEKFSNHSAAFVQYYYWIFPFGLGLTLFTLLEAYAWQVRRSILTNFLREVQARLTTTILLLLLFAGVIGNFGTLIKFYSFGYLALALVLVVFLARKGELHLPLTVSRVTKKFRSRILYMLAMGWTASIVFNLSFFFAQIVIAAVVPDGLSFVAIYTLAQYVANVMQAPQRGIIAAATGPLSRAWKDKDMGRIQRIYARSSLNQLIFAIGIFVLLWLNFTDAVYTLKLKPEYLKAESVFVIIGLTRIIDMGTGVNAQIIGTSIYWRFELFSGLILVALTLPLNYFLALRLGVIGPAVADLITFAVYNGIRWGFLYRKFRLQPFSSQTMYALLLGLAVGGIGFLLFHDRQGFLWLIARSATVAGLYATGVITFKLSPDVIPVWHTVRKRLGLHA
jgi:O-antigen/teichoic acid export membrane protein